MQCAVDVQLASADISVQLSRLASCRATLLLVAYKVIAYRSLPLLVCLSGFLLWLLLLPTVLVSLCHCHPIAKQHSL